MLPVISKTLLQTTELADLSPVLSLIILLVMNLENVWYDWVIFKFKENRYEKFLRLIELHRRVAKEVEKEDMMDPDLKLET